MNAAPPSGTQGPQVDAAEDLFRGITTDDWWVAEEGRPSSAAFRHPDFSVDVISLAGTAAFTLAHLPPGSGLVQFNCGDARAINFDARLEADPENPENHAHANVYSLHSTSQRKKAAQRLVGLCRVVQVPNFPAQS
jgi:hypothetical protein